MITNTMTKPRTTRLRYAAFIITAFTFVSGCSDACPEISPCDIRRSSCQQKVARVAACLRGGAPVSPEFEVVPRETLIEESSTESAQSRDLRRGLALFGLEPAEIDTEQLARDYWDTIGAFYSPASNKVTVVDRGRPMNTAGMTLLLLHEYIHAMQYAAFDDEYLAMHGNTFDSNLAFSSIVEGEAILYQDLAHVRAAGSDEDDISWTHIFARYQASTWRTAQSDDHRYRFASRRFVYAYGGGYVNHAWRAGRNAAVRRVYEEIPHTTRQVIAGFNAGPPNGDRFSDVPNEVGVPSAIEGYERAAVRRLGAWMFDALRSVVRPPHHRATAFEDMGFAGDVFSAWRDPITDDITSVWRLRFDDADQAAAFVATLPVFFNADVLRDDRDVILLASTDPTLSHTLIAELQWTPAPESDWSPTTDDAVSIDIRHGIRCALHAP